MPNLSNPYFAYVYMEHNALVETQAGLTYTNLQLVKPKREEVIIAGSKYLIQAHQVTIFDVSPAEIYTYIADLDGLDRPGLILNVEVNMRNKSLNTLRFQDIYSGVDVDIELTTTERSHIVNLAQIFSFPAMKALHLHKNTELQRRVEEFEQQFRQNFKKDISEQLLQIDQLLIDAQELHMLGGIDFTSACQAYKVQLLRQIPMQVHETEEEEEFVIVESEAVLLQKEKAEKLILAKRQKFNQKLQQLAKHERSQNQYLEFIDTAAIIEYCKLVDEMLGLLIGDSDIKISAEELALVCNAKLKSAGVCLQVLTEVLEANNTANFPKLAELESYTRHLLDRFLIELLAQDKVESLFWILGTGDHFLDLVEAPVALADSRAINLLEVALDRRNLRAFQGLLELGVSPIFINNNNRAFAHDIVQGHPRFALAMLESNQISLDLANFFKALACLISIWQARVEINVLEATELATLGSCYLGLEHMSNVTFAQDLDYFDNPRLEVLAMTGLTIDNLAKLRCIPAFRKAFISYCDTVNQYIDAVAAAGYSDNCVYRLIEHMRLHPMYSEQRVQIELQSFRHDENMLRMAIDVIETQTHLVSLDLEKKKSGKSKQRNKIFKECQSEFEEDARSIVDMLKSRHKTNNLTGKVFNSVRDYTFTLFNTVVADDVKSSQDSSVCVLAEPVHTAYQVSNSKNTLLGYKAG